MYLVHKIVFFLSFFFFRNHVPETFHESRRRFQFSDIHILEYNMYVCMRMWLSLLTIGRGGSVMKADASHLSGARKSEEALHQVDTLDSIYTYILYIHTVHTYIHTYIRVCFDVIRVRLCIYTHTYIKVTVHTYIQPSNFRYHLENANIDTYIHIYAQQCC